MAASSAAPLANARPARERGRAASTRLASLPLLLPLLPLLALLAVLLLLHAPTSVGAAAIVAKRSYSDQSVRGYLTERACWWNEICKEEFQTQFRCKCPQWSYCRSPGRYYNAYCTVTGTGYIWTQPGWGGSAAAAAPAAAAGA